MDGNRSRDSEKLLESVKNIKSEEIKVSIYVFGQAVGQTADSVDYMRIYKEKMQGETSASIKYILSEIPEQKQIDKYVEAGIDAEQLVSMYQYFTDNHISKLSRKTEKKLDELKSSLHFTRIIRLESEIKLVKDGYVIATILLDEEEQDYYRGICYYSYANLIRMEIYTDGIAYTNFYITAESGSGLYAKLVRRSFYNYDGSVAYDQLLEGEERFIFPDGSFYDKPEFINKFVKKLDLSDQDIVFLDYSVPREFLKSVFKYGKAAPIVALASVKYDSMKNEDLYHFWFPYTEALSSMVVSTEEQKKMLAEELKTYHCSVPDIRVASIEGVFENTVLYESYDENLALSWEFRGKPNGFLIYDEKGALICETRNSHQHYFLIKGYGKENIFFLKAFVDTSKGKMVVAESEPIHWRSRQYTEPLVSLIVPVYNAECFIARTVDNVLAQSFPDLEIIVVDDGSEDGTGEILDWYAKKYPNVKVIRQTTNGGVAAARNKGIEYASGEYIGFIDSDDMIRPDMVRRMYGSAKTNDCDVVVTSAYWLTEWGYGAWIYYQAKENVAIDTENFIQKHYISSCKNGLVAWNKLYRASIVKTRLFPVARVDEDVAWTPYILSYANRICYLNGYFYEWDRIVHDDSLCSTFVRYTKEKRFESHRSAFMFFMKNGNPERKHLLKNIAIAHLIQLEREYRYEKYGELRTWIDENF